MRPSPTAPLTFVDELLHHPDHRIALVDHERSVTYRELRSLVDDRAHEFALDHRSIVLVAGPNSLDLVVTYLAVLRDGHVALLAGDDDRVVERMDALWTPDLVARTTGSRLHLRRNRTDPRSLHPELTLLLSTSGSTGNPKLVRLSHRNLLSNARSIGQSLAIDDSDVGITSLPLAYTYGLSVLHSHLAAGACVVLTDRSVVDPCFRSLLTEHGVTNLAGVPHSWDMIERAGAEHIWTPTLRQLTQAGGRLEPDAVRRWAERAEAHDADFVVMYGQTEATARMAYLPPHLTSAAPGSIGVAIPGGEFSLRPVDGHTADVGELVYRGENVMMGYATEPDDLALGPGDDELATGDLARFDPVHGLYEIVGRRSRFIKPFGLRIDLDDVAKVLSQRHDVDAKVAGDDKGMVVVASGRCPSAVRATAVELTGLPVPHVAVHDEPVPRTASGKVDDAAIMALARSAPDAASPIASGAGPMGDPSVARRAAVVAAFAPLIDADRPARPDDTFVSLGGDSLGYVECSIRLESALGHLPHDWHLVPIDELADTAGGATSGTDRRLARVDTTVVLRAVAICMVVATHMRLWHVPGGAHTLLAVAGYNMARFLGPIDDGRERVLAGLRTAARAAVPTMVWVAVGMAVVGSYGFGTLFLVNNYLGPASHAGDDWHFWFVEVFVHLAVLTTAVLAVPFVRRLERRHRYLVPLVVLVAALLLRTIADDGTAWYNLRYRTHGVAWFFVLGWLIHQSDTLRLRIATTVACVVAVSGFFDVADREWRITVALVALLWMPRVPMPRIVVAPIGALAAASLWIYITHFTFWPPLDSFLVREWAYVATIAAGMATWYLASRVQASATSGLRAFSRAGQVLRRPTRDPVTSGQQQDELTGGEHRDGANAVPAR